jgi:hypothetical protein
MTLAICVPVTDNVKYRFSFALAELTAYLTRNNIDYRLFFQNGSMLVEQRHALVLSAIKANCKEILWLDSDMVFPPNLYHKLSKHKKLVVAGLYSTRVEPYKLAGCFANTVTTPLNEMIGLKEVESTGMGLMLTSIEVFETIPAPWFSFKYDNKYDGYIGEDIYFCNLLKDYDIKVYADLDISKFCSHTGTVEIMLRDIK